MTKLTAITKPNTCNMKSSKRYLPLFLLPLPYFLLLLVSWVLVLPFGRHITPAFALQSGDPKPPCLQKKRELSFPVHCMLLSHTAGFICIIFRCHKTLTVIR